MIRGSARPWRWLGAAVVCAAAAIPIPAAAQPLAVPFLPQTEDLCGGAAAAMVMRYWGAADVYPDAFASLVDRSAGGIRAGDLVADLQHRGWSAVAGAGTRGDLSKELGRGRPVIVLIQDRPGRFHYVVAVALSGDRVTVHDPARGPSREIDAARFDAAWEESGRWMLIVLPPAIQGATPPAPAAAPAPQAPDSRATVTACDGMVAEAVGRVEMDRAEARALLSRAIRQCPADAAGWRELAGLDALDQNWTAAVSHAEAAVARQPDDGYAWRILATARYVQHDDVGALAAWNHVGEPAVNLIDVKGLEHTRYDVIADAIGVELKAVLTPDAIARADRRVREVPSVAAARIAFHPVEEGRAQIDASIVERARRPSGYPALIGFGLDAAANRQVAAAFSNVSGGGDLAGVAWRWWAHRPMVSAFYAAPAPRAIGSGVWRVDLSRETQTFGGAGKAPFEETRTRAAMALRNWMSARTRLTGGAAFERWQARPSDVAFTGGLEHWRMADRVRVSAEVTHAVGAAPFTTARAMVAARSKTANAGLVVLGQGGYSAASDESPASSWPGADTGHARDVLLRAHPLLDDGIVVGGAFGRRLAFATAEAQRWTSFRRLPIRWAPAAFVDLARATRGLQLSDSRMHVDAGVGLRLAAPGAATMRLDLAHGLRDGGFVLSVGFESLIPHR